jgi:anaerobic magnesium-protoporphyrin IX monomethyl ester cyclase
MGYVLAYMKSLGYGGVIIDDVQDRPLSLYALEMWIQRLKPAAIGFTAYQHNMERIRFFASYIKSHHKNIIVLLGGPQAIFMPSAALRELEVVDIICRGEGETTAVAIAECLEKKRPLLSVSGITFRDGDDIVDTPVELDLIEDLDQFPSPYLNGLINLEGKEQAIIFSSRGCKFGCLFCISPSIGGTKRKMRYHSAKRVLDEMEYLAAKGIKRFWFADSSFPESRERALQILQGKIDRGIETPFWCEMRCDLVDEPMLRKLREANADTISFGLESANSEVLKKTAKGIVLQDLRRLIWIAKSIGLNVELSCMYGLPGETVDRARETLHFIQSFGIPIDGNSRAQQMRLFFGSAFEKNRDRFGFKSIQGYLPAYLSTGDRYETETLTGKDLKRIGAIWMLAWEDLRRQVQNKEAAFDVLNFLLTNEEYLLDERVFYEYGAIASCTLEEQQLFWRFMDKYVSQLNPSESRLNKFISTLRVFEETDRGADARSRIIFDGHSELDESSDLGMKDGYWDIMLGQGLFPHSFEKGLLGVRDGERRTFSFAIPKDYARLALRNRNLKVSGKVQKVLNPVNISSLDQLKQLNMRNHYPFGDLDRLLNEDVVLHYLALRDIAEPDLAKMPTHFLLQVYNYARLHKIGDIRRMTTYLADDKKALNGVADMLYSAGRYLEAAHYYERADPNESNALIKKARCLFLAGEPQKALEVLNSVPDKSSLSFQECYLDCLKMVLPWSERIPSLDRNVLHLKVENVLDNEIVSQAEHGAIQPVVHGDGR